MGATKKDLRTFDNEIKNTQPDPQKKIRIKLADSLGCVVNKGGSKIFVTRYRMPGDKHQRDYAHHPAYPRLTVTDAFDRHDEIVRLVMQGIDPKQNEKHEAAKNLAKPTFREVAKTYFEDAITELRERTYNDYMGRYQRWISATLDDRKIEDIDSPEVLRLIDAVKRGAGKDCNNKGTGKRTASIVMTVLSNIFNHAVTKGVINARSNPLLGYTSKGLKINQKRKKDHRFLDTTELKLTWQMLEIYKNALKISTVKASACQILILTGLRTNEAIDMRWSEIAPIKGPDGSIAEKYGAIYTIPTSRMKADRPHEIYLSPFAVKIISAHRTCSDFVFPSPRFPEKRASYGTHGDGIKKLFGNDQTDETPRLTIKSFSPHDLRRSFATGVRVEFRVSKSTIHEMIAHSKKDDDFDEVLDQIYIRDENTAEKKTIWQQWSDLIEQMVTPNPDTKHQSPLL